MLFYLVMKLNCPLWLHGIPVAVIVHVIAILACVSAQGKLTFFAYYLRFIASSLINWCNSQMKRKVNCKGIILVYYKIIKQAGFVFVCLFVFVFLILFDCLFVFFERRNLKKSNFTYNYPKFKPPFSF